MAFFNLTQLGQQNLFKTATTTPDDSIGTPQAQGALIHGSVKPQAMGGAIGSPSITNDKSSSALERDLNRREVRFTAIETAPSTSHIATYSTSRANAPHGGSYIKYTQLLQKHHRHPQGPTELYNHPLTTSQTYGWWMSQGQPHRQPWAQGPRHVHVNSEMTRFVDEMSQTNKEFTLY